MRVHRADYPKLLQELTGRTVTDESRARDEVSYICTILRKAGVIDGARLEKAVSPFQRMILAYLLKYGPATDDDIAGDQEVSIMTVRNALSDLIFLGLLTKTTKSGKTAYVANLPKQEKN
jgi:predicted transcriptional regulator